MHQVWGGAEVDSSSYTSGASSSNIEGEDASGQEKYDNIQWNSVSDSTTSGHHDNSSGAVGNNPTDEACEAQNPEEALPNGLPSRGSVKHESGKCSPCHYFHTKAGCKNGSTCGYCHMHGKDFRPRPCKSKRAKAKSQVGILDNIDDPEIVERIATEMESKGGYLKVVVQSKLRQQQHPPQPPVQAEEKKGPSKPQHKRNIICL
mmetsp:Transcript_47940/g.95380  ORF Transcript_47940/g.95380 Transcript_47940/m.95380 type:complete len:204 (-) Transcript_47940:69-680(-)